jgi:hypothetical protein
MIRAHDHMISHLDLWTAELDRRFDLPQNAAETNDPRLAAQRESLQRLEAVVSRLDAQQTAHRGPGNLNEALANLTALTNALQELTEATKKTDKRLKPTLKPLDPEERRKLTVTLLDRALQWAAWRQDAKFAAWLDKQLASEDCSDILRALGRLSLVIQNVAQALSVDAGIQKR